MNVKNNILALYQQDLPVTEPLQKGGKKAVVGEVRYWNGGKDAWVKHPGGWVHYHKDGVSHRFEPVGSGGKYIKATAEHAAFAKPHLEHHLRKKAVEEGLHEEHHVENYFSGKKTTTNSPKLPKPAVEKVVEPKKEEKVIEKVKVELAIPKKESKSKISDEDAISAVRGRLSLKTRSINEERKRSDVMQRTFSNETIGDDKEFLKKIKEYVGKDGITLKEGWDETYDQDEDEKEEWYDREHVAYLEPYVAVYKNGKKFDEIYMTNRPTWDWDSTVEL